MNRWITASFVLFAACQTGAETTDVEQGLTTEDCVPGGNYKYAKLPSLKLWNGDKPVAKEGQLLLDVADWRPNTKASGEGFHIGLLTDPGSGEILWGATIPDDKLPAFRSGNPNQPQIGDCCRPPPCGCRACCDSILVDTWMAKNVLEASLRYVEVAANAAAAAGSLK